MVKADELEKLATLKSKGIITEEEFNTKKQEYFIAAHKKDNIVIPVICVVLGVIIVISSINYITNIMYNRQSDTKLQSNLSDSVGKSGFRILMYCQLYGNPMPFQSCTKDSEVIITSGSETRSYSGYNISEAYDVPQHFSFYIFNGSDTFSFNVRTTDIEKNKITDYRSIGPYSSATIGY